MRVGVNAAIAGAALGLSSCATEIATSPDTFSIDQGHVSHLRAKQTVALKNSFAAESTFPVALRGGNTWVFDQKQMTDTAITMLQRGLEKQSIATAPQAPKTVTLRAHTPRATLVSRVAIAQVWAVVHVDAEFGDGSRTSVRAENQSPVGAQRAFDGAIVIALNMLLQDPKFIAYLNQ